MKISIIKERDVIVSKWSGGESRQYFIYPNNSSYAKRDFLFRVSMAVSNTDEEALYSDLENYTRNLVMLEGTAHVYHKEHYDIKMNPYEEIDVFDGGWKSSATGRVTDFNLMTSKECIGGMSVISNSSVVEIKPAENFNKKNWLMFFCGYGSSSFKISTGETIMITKGDLLVFENITPEIKINIQTTDSKLIKMYVRC